MPEVEVRLVRPEAGGGDEGPAVSITGASPRDVTVVCEARVQGLEDMSWKVCKIRAGQTSLLTSGAGGRLKPSIKSGWSKTKKKNPKQKQKNKRSE